MQVPFFRFEYDETALRGIEECLRSGWLTTGPKTKEFERLFAEYLQYDGELYTVAMNSCTAALHLALEAIGLQKGEIVIVPAMTFAATAEVVRYFDAFPVFVDTDPETLNLSAVHLEQVIRAIRANKRVPGVNAPHARIRAIIPVHYGGQPCRMDEIRNLASTYEIDIVEDAAHAFPAGWIEDGKVKFVGAGTSRVACFSFYANKTITTGEGGMAVTAEPELAERMRIMSLHGMNRDAWKRFSASGSWDYQLIAPGFKYNLTDIAAAIGISQLQQAEDFRQKRQSISMRYNVAFRDEDGLELLHWNPGVQHSYHLYVVKLQLDALRINRAEFIEQLKAKGVMCSVHWRPLHMHPYYIETCGYRREDFPIAATVWERLVSLPLFPSMTAEEQEYVIGSVQEICRTNRA